MVASPSYSWVLEALVKPGWLQNFIVMLHRRKVDNFREASLELRLCGLLSRRDQAPGFLESEPAGKGAQLSPELSIAVSTSSFCVVKLKTGHYPFRL